MALNGDDEIELLLSQMGGGGAAATPVHAETTSEEVKSEKKKKKKKKSINKDDRSSHKRKKKKRKRDHSKDDVVAKDSLTIFAESRLTQNPYDWPCCSNGIRLLELSSGLAHDCNDGYSSSAEKEETNKYGSNPCKNCGKSAATHELCISSSKTNKDDDDPFSATSIASIITSARNARCILGEYEKEKEKFEQSIMPPVNATRVSAKFIMSKLDLYVGRILSRVKKMENNRTRSALISSSDIDLLREKVSTLVKASITYKEAIKTICSSTASGVANISTSGARPSSKAKVIIPSIKVNS